MMKRKIKGIFILATACLGVCALGFANIKSEKVYANELSTLTGQAFTQEDYRFEGYSVRFDETLTFQAENSGNTSLRFKFSISPALYTYLTQTDGAKTGTLIYPSYYLEDRSTEHLTVESTGGENGEVVPFNVETTEAWQYVEGKDLYQSVSYIKEIPLNSYGFDVAVRGYLQVGDEYYYTTATESKSLAEVASLEYENQSSTFTAEVKSKLKESLLKYTVSIDGETSEKYYGEKLSAPTEKSGYLFVGYRIYGRTEMWDVENTTVYGAAKLTSEYVKLGNYYSIAKNSATFEIKNLPSGVTKAYIGDKEYACTSTYQSLKIAGLTDLVAGQNYVIRAVSGSGKSYFVAFTAVTDIKPVASGDFLDYDFSDGSEETHRVVSIVDESGKAIEHTGAWLDGIPANYTSTPKEQVIKVTDDNNDVYVFLLKIYTDVIHNNEDADEFFLGSVSGEEVYWDDALIEQDLNGCYALANDVTLSVPLAHTRTKGGLRGVFDGLGHTITWETDAKSGATNCSPALFGYNFTGTIKNVGFDFTVNGTYGKKMNMLSDYASAPNVIVENVYVNIKVGQGITVTRDLSVSLWSSRIAKNAVHFKDVVIINSLAKHGLNGSKQMLFGYDRIWVSGNQVADGADIYLGNDNLVSTSVVNMQNVYVVVEDLIKVSATSLAWTEDSGTVFAENAKPTTFQTHQGWYKGTAVYNYTIAKDNALVQIGSWLLDYETGITAVSATYQD